MPNGLRLAIGGPTRDTVPAAFAVDLAQLYAHTSARGPWQTVTVGFLTATYIHMGREYFLEASMKQGATHVLWLDTDMSVPPETAIRLAQHEQPIVACNYVTRDGNRMFTARRDGRRIETTPESTGLETVDGVGFGVLLMRTDVMRTLARPWFRHGLNARDGDIGEDLMCCHALRAAGYAIHIDHDLSKEIGHIGQHTYRTLADEAVTA
jgi:hypothetical protein